jgi:clan AA aspartic protease (TIGR02281 family)
VLRASKGGSGSASSARFDRTAAQVCTVAICAGLLTGCLESARVLNELQDDATFVIRESGSGLDVARHPLTSVRRTPPGPAAEPIPLRADSDGYWNAIAELNLPASRVAARNEQETHFAEAFASLAAGDHEKAEIAFRAMSSQATDLNVAAASQVMLATTLLYEHKWAALRDLLTGSQLGLTNHRNPGPEQWGQAFGDLESGITTFPDLPVTLPLRMTAVGTPTIQVRINGKNFRFWLDTGSSITVLSSNVAADADVSPLGTDTLTVATFAGIAPARPAVLKRLEIGSIVIANIPAIVMDDQLMRVKATAEGVSRAGIHVDGIIGWDTIRQFDIYLDYQNEKITLRRPENLGTSGTAAQNLTWMGRPYVEVRTTLGTTLHFTLDTGSQGSFLNAPTVDKLGITARNSDTRAYGIGRSGGEPAQVVPALKLDVGGRSLLLQHLLVYKSTSSSLVNCDGILGSDIGPFGTIRIDATNGLFSIGPP